MEGERAAAADEDEVAVGNGDDDADVDTVPLVAEVLREVLCAMSEVGHVLDDKCLDDFLSLPDSRLMPVVPDTMVVGVGRRLLELVLTVDVVASVVEALGTVVLDDGDRDDLDDRDEDLDDFGDGFDGDDLVLEPAAEVKDGGR